MKFQIDLGATINVIPRRFVKNIQLSNANTTLKMWNGATTHPIGKCRINIKNLLTPLLGRKAAEHMQHITFNYDNIAHIHATHEFTEPTVLTDYSAIFDDGLGTLPGVVQLHIGDTIQPVSSRPRRIPITLEKDVSRELDNIVKQGVICPVNEPSEWVSEMAVTTRKSGAIRICIDQRPLNIALKRLHYQPPTIDVNKGEHVCYCI